MIELTKDEIADAILQYCLANGRLKPGYYKVKVISTETSLKAIVAPQ